MDNIVQQEQQVVDPYRRVMTYRAQLEDVMTALRLPNGQHQQQMVRLAMLASPSLLAILLELRQRNRNIVVDSGEHKEWQKSFSQEDRNHLIDILLQPMYAARNPAEISCKEVFYGELIARQHENEVFETANSRTEYYRMLSGRIMDVEIELKMELEEEEMRRQLADEQVNLWFG